MRKTIGLGEAVLDIIFKDGRPIAAVPGGSTFNSMVSLGRTIAKENPFVKVVMVTRTGDDKVGDIIADFMKSNGMSTEALTRLPGRQSSLSIAQLDSRNDATYEFYRDSSMGAFTFPDIDVQKDDVILFGSSFAVNPTLREGITAFLSKARSRGAIIYYDINFRKGSDLSLIKPFIEENCALSSIVRGSSEDILAVFGSDDAATVYENHISKLCPNFICTHGAGPIEVLSPNARSSFKTPRVKTVSTIGAGDNFNAGFIYALLRYGFDSQVVSDMNASAHTLAVRYARRFSSAVCRSLFNYVDADFLERL